MLGEGEADWAMGEAFAFGSLLQDKVHVRLSGTVSTLLRYILCLLMRPCIRTYIGTSGKGPSDKGPSEKRTVSLERTVLNHLWSKTDTPFCTVYM